VASLTKFARRLLAAAVAASAAATARREGRRGKEGAAWRTGVIWLLEVELDELGDAGGDVLPVLRPGFEFPLLHGLHGRHSNSRWEERMTRVSTTSPVGVDDELDHDLAADAGAAHFVYGYCGGF